MNYSLISNGLNHRRQTISNSASAALDRPLHLNLWGDIAIVSSADCVAYHLLTRQCKLRKGVETFQGFQSQKCNVYYCGFNSYRFYL